MAGTEKKAPFKAWEIILSWAKANNLFAEPQEHRFFTFHNYNTERDKSKQWYEVMVTYEGTIHYEHIKKKHLKGDII